MTLFLCDFPKPVHGMANVNKYVFDTFKKTSSHYIVLNTSPSYASNLFGSLSWVFVKFFHFIFCLFRLFILLVLSKPNVVYRPIYGGYGQFFDLCYLFLLKLSKCHTVIHHHSFNYLNKKSNLFKCLLFLMKKTDRHVVLGEAMKNRLMELYLIDPDRIFIVSNLSFSPRDKFDVKENLLRKSHVDHIKIGYLANLSFEKGLDFFINTLILINEAGVKVNALIAGPCTSSAVKSYLDDALGKYSFIKYLGPLYGEEKDNFYTEIDIFYFPSFYRNEAEPLVIFEAAEYGAFVIGTEIGCMKEQISNFLGLHFSVNTTSNDAAVMIIEFIDSNNFTLTQRLNRIKLYSTKTIESNQGLNNLISILKVGYVPESF